MSNKITIIGAGGRMGCAIIEAIKENGSVLSGAVDNALIGIDSGENAGIGKNGILITDDAESAIKSTDITIDFTTPSATIKNIKINAQNKIPGVIGTTGLTDDELKIIEEAAKEIPIVFSPNMSVGVNLLFKLTELTAKILNKGYDIEIIEAHHRMKKDAPSGTATKILDILLETLGRDKEKDAVYGRKGIIGERKDNEIGMSVIRGGDIFGDHTVLFAGNGERIELTHKASGRQKLASGAVQAANWIKDKKPGLYNMFDVLGL